MTIYVTVISYPLIKEGDIAYARVINWHSLALVQTLMISKLLMVTYPDMRYRCALSPRLEFAAKYLKWFRNVLS